MAKIMVHNMTAGVTFDLWNTLLVEVAPAISRDRALIILEEFAKTNPNLKIERIEIAINRAWDLHRTMWNNGTRLRSKDAALLIARLLNIDISDKSLEIIQNALEYMRPIERLVPCDNLHKLFEQLSFAGVRIGLISDTGFSPGTVLLERLKQFGLEHFFAGTSFSDEVGAFKPARAIFEHSLSYLKCEPANVIHVGDLWKNDIDGARRAGFRTIRYRAWNDDEPQGPDAHFISDNHTATAQWIISQI